MSLNAIVKKFGVVDVNFFASASPRSVNFCHFFSTPCQMVDVICKRSLCICVCLSICTCVFESVWEEELSSALVFKALKECC